MHRALAVATVVLGLALGACPGQTSGGNTQPGNPSLGGGTEGGGPAQPTALTSDQLEEIQNTVRAGKDGVTACYTSEMERTQNKKLVGKVMVKVLIGVNKAADQVQIGEATLTGRELHACIIGVVKSWEFPKLNTASWFTYPYEFSPAY